MHPDPRDILVAPGHLQGPTHQPLAKALARRAGDQAEKGDLGLARLAEIEFEHPHFNTRPVGHGKDVDLRIVDDRAQRRIVEREARPPQPLGPHPAKQQAIFGQIGRLPAHELQGHILFRHQPPQAGGRFAHFERGDHRRQIAGRQRMESGRKARAVFRNSHQLHTARGGRLIRIASILPPVLRPNSVPRS